jgi:ComF family protein
MLFSKFMGYLSKIFNYCLLTQCIFCLAPLSSSKALCASCQANLPILSQLCARCAQFLGPYYPTNAICGQCLLHPPPYAVTHVLFPYVEPIMQMIIKLKFQGDLHMAKLFAQLMIEAIQQQWYTHTTKPDLILPVPLHPNRLRERGFNQALEIARPIAKQLGIPLGTQLVLRHKDTLAQSGLSARERKRNIKNAFSTRHHFQEMHIAILDDVMTTGQTVSEIAKLLHQNGAKRIDIWCCARREVAQKLRRL